MYEQSGQRDWNWRGKGSQGYSYLKEDLVRRISWSDYVDRKAVLFHLKYEAHGMDPFLKWLPNLKLFCIHLN